MKHERKTHRWHALGRIAGGILLCLLAGCAAMSRPTPVTEGLPGLSAPTEDLGWRRIRFRMDRPDGVTHWENDLLIAHRIIAPVLAAHGPEIQLWRFHRRAADDDMGHQFSFIFYSGAMEAASINRQVLEDPFLARMMTRQWVREVLVDEIADNTRPDIEDTSDANWSPVMRAAWPHYIMGVSRMWLEMIDRISTEVGAVDETDADQVAAHYSAVEAEVNKIWQSEAYHALLHHLNAIYGYKPMIYWEKHLKTF